MSNGKFLSAVAGLCAALIAFLEWLRPKPIGDFGLGLSVGVLLGLSLLVLTQGRLCRNLKARG